MSKNKSYYIFKGGSLTAVSLREYKEATKENLNESVCTYQSQVWERNGFLLDPQGGTDSEEDDAV